MPTAPTTGRLQKRRASKRCAARPRTGTPEEEQPPLAAHGARQQTRAPFFSPVRRVRADSLLRQWDLHQGPIDALPSPGDALHVVALGQSRFSQRFEEASLFPFEEALVNGAGTAKALAA